MKCEYCRQQLLPYLYDALEPAERQALAEHLEICPHCQEALKTARQQQTMLAEAIALGASDIVFKAPVKATPATPTSSAETVVLPHAPRRSLFLLNRWAIAAGILLFLFSTGSVIAWTIYRDNSARFEQARERLVKAKQDAAKGQEEFDRKKNQSQKEVREIQKQIDSLFSDWKELEAKKTRELEEKRAQLPQIIVNGPQYAVAGAPNSYEIEMRQDAVSEQLGQANKELKKKLPAAPQQAQNMQARVVDQNNKILYQQNLKMAANSRANLDLPPELPIKPGDNIAIEFLAETPDGKTVQLLDNLKLAVLDYVTHLATDRPIYRPGDTVRFRSLTLERYSLKPAQQKLHLRYRIVGPNHAEIFAKEASSELLTADKKPIQGPGGVPLFGLGAGEFALPADLAEGEYTLSVSEANDRFQEEKRSFLVRRWQAPRLNKEVQFQRSSYGPGDQVRFTVRAVPVQGAAPFQKNMQIQAHVTIDGVALPDPTRVNDTDGQSEFQFTLPGQILKGVGTLTVTCDDGANREALVRPLPIVLRDLHVDFYPEGGDLIVGVPNRVYFQARTPANKPADLQGVILDDKKIEVARIHTVSDDKEPGINQGLGAFTFTPAPNRRYTLRIDSPIGIDRPIALPQAKLDGVALHIPQGVVDNEIAVTLHNAQKPRDLLIGAYCRGRMLDHKAVTAPANQTVEVMLQPNAPVGGVFRITVFEKILGKEQPTFRPIAERLIYRKNQAKVDVACAADRTSYQPGETVQLQLQALNEKRESVPALAMVAVVESSVLKLRDEKTARSMPTHFLLTTEIRDPQDLEHADFFLGDHPKSALALDLLLGSQGWRRFAEQNPKRFQEAQQKGRAPVFLANANSVPQLLESEQKQLDKLDGEFMPKAVKLQKELAQAERAAPQARVRVQEAPPEHLIEQAQMQVDEAGQRLREIRMFLVQFGLGGMLLTLLFVGFYLVSIGLRRLSEGGRARPFLTAGIALLSLLFIISIIGTFSLMGTPFDDGFRFAGKRAMPMPAPAPPVIWQGFGQGPPGGEMQQLAEFEAVEDEVVNLDANRMQARQAPAQFFQNGQFADLGAMQPPPPEAIVWVQKRLGRRVQVPPVQELCVVREYAHRHPPEPDGVRRDFAETLYWQPALIMPDGKARLQFDLSDAVTRFQVLVLSNTLDGRLGANTIEIASRLPFHLDPKTPIEVTQTDQIAIPVAIANESPKKISAQVSARVKGLALQDNAERTVVLDPNQNKRVVVHVNPSITEGVASVRVVGKTNGYADAIERKFTVVPDGFPVKGAHAGILENNPVDHEIDLPADWVPGSLEVRAHFYPSPAAELQAGLQSLLREPIGCFEQASSSNYPNTLVLGYLKQTRDTNPLLEKHARQLLDTGYPRLTSFECKDDAGKRGFEWFGASPPHEALTAYGLLQFRDMARFSPVDEAMLARTEKFLLDQRDGKGGFRRNPKALDQFGRAPQDITNAYVLWALTESGVKENLARELAAVSKACNGSRDPYLISLAALAHFNRREKLEGDHLLGLLAPMQKDDGRFVGMQTSITGSQGNDLAVETTSLAILALSKSRRFEYDRELASAVRWLGKQRRGQGGFGGTQATVLALKAVLAYHQRQPRAVNGGEVFLSSRNQPRVGRFNQNLAPQEPGAARTAFGPRHSEPITLTLPERELEPGKNVITLNVTGNNALPYTLAWSYRTLKPPSDPRAPVKLAAKLSAAKMEEGGTVKLTATIENASGKGQGMAIAILGLPAGLAVPEDAQQLKAMVGRDKDGISAWEIKGRELILYWRDLAPNAKIQLELDLICRLPGVYRGPASRAYLYYDAERKFWAEPLNIRIHEAE